MQRYLSAERCLRVKRRDHREYHSAWTPLRLSVWVLLVWNLTVVPLTLGLIPGPLWPLTVGAWVAGLFCSPYLTTGARRIVDRFVLRGLYSDDLASRRWALGIVAASSRAPIDGFRPWGNLAYAYTMREGPHQSFRPWMGDIVSALHWEARRRPERADEAHELFQRVFSSGSALDACEIATLVHTANNPSHNRLWDSDILEFLRGAAALVVACENSPLRTQLAYEMAPTWTTPADDLADAVLALCPDKPRERSLVPTSA